MTTLTVAGRRLRALSAALQGIAAYTAQSVLRGILMTSLTMNRHADQVVLFF